MTVIVPFNWPIAILAAALPHALLAGNTAIVKPPPSTPLATTRLVQRVAEKLPPGVLNVVTGRDSEMAGLIENPDVAKVCFTGSVNGGKRIMEMASRSLTRVTLELGGNDPAIIREDAVLDDDHLDRLFGAIYDTTGQICMNAKRLYVHRSRMDELVAGLSARLEKVVLGHGLAEGTTMGPLHQPAQKAFVSEIVEEAKDAGATVLEFGELPGGEFAEGNFLRPAIVVDPDPSLRVVTQEQFGPVIPVIPFDDDADAVRLANDTWAGLCASVWTADTDAATRLGGQLECGYVWVNDHGAARLDLRAPFGGMKHSGMGREQGIEGVRAFQDTRSIAHPAPTERPRPRTETTPAGPAGRSPAGPAVGRATAASLGWRVPLARPSTAFPRIRPHRRRPPGRPPPRVARRPRRLPAGRAPVGRRRRRRRAGPAGVRGVRRALRAARRGLLGRCPGAQRDGLLDELGLGPASWPGTTSAAASPRSSPASPRSASARWW